MPLEAGMPVEDYSNTALHEELPRPTSAQGSISEQHDPARRPASAIGSFAKVTCAAFFF